MKPERFEQLKSELDNPPYQIRRFGYSIGEATELMEEIVRLRYILEMMIEETKLDSYYLASDIACIARDALDGKEIDFSHHYDDEDYSKGFGAW